MIQTKTLNTYSSSNRRTCKTESSCLQYHGTCWQLSSYIDTKHLHAYLKALHKGKQELAIDARSCFLSTEKASVYTL